MLKIFQPKKQAREKDFGSVAKKQLTANKAVLKSLRDYDEGKKEISTANVKRHLQGLQTPS